MADFEQRVISGGRVLFVPSSRLVVRIVGVNECDEWIAEFACREQDFGEKFIIRMEDHLANVASMRTSGPFRVIR